MADFSITGDVRLNSDPAEQSVNKWTVAAGQMIADFAKKAADALMSVVKSGLSYNRDMESYLTNFKVMLGDEQLAAEKLEEIRKMAASTPFTLSDLTEGTQTLLQFGIAADDTTNVLQMLGDISLGNADKMQTLVRAYGKMSSAQKVTLENVNMMIDAGFNPLNQICEATGESMADLYKRISAGKVGFEELQAAVEAATSEGGQFYNGMLEASQTFRGRLSTLQDNVAALTGKLTDGLFSALGDLIVKANELVVSITEDDQKLAKLKDTIGLVITVVTSVGVAFLTYKGYLTATSAATVVQTAATTALAAAQDAAQNGATGLAIAQEVLNKTLKANPVGLVVSVLAALAAALVTAYQTSETFRNIVDGAFQAVANIAKSAIGAAIGWLDKLSYKLNSFLGKDGYTGFSSYDDYKADKDAQAAAATSKANREARHKAAQAGQGISTKSWTELQEEAKAAQKTTEQTASAVSASSKKASSSAKKAASEVVNSITSTSTQIENGVTRTTETVHETLKNGTKQQKQTVTETSRQMVDGVLSDVKTITTTAADGTKKVTQSIEAVRDVVSTVTATQTALVDGAKVTTQTTTETLADGSEQVKRVITSTGTEVIEGVQHTVKTVTTIAADGTKIQTLDGNKLTIGVLILAILSVLIFFGHYKLTKERIAPIQKKKGDYNAFKAIGDLAKNRPFVMLCLVSMLLIAFQFYYQATYQYLFADYYHSAQLYALVTICTYLPMAILIPIMNKLIDKFGKKELCAFGMGFAALVSFILFFIKTDNPYVFLVFTFFSGLGQTFLVLEVWALVMDVIDYHEIRTHRREEGTAYAVVSFARKLGQTLAGVGLNALLAVIHYDSTASANNTALPEDVLNKLYDISTLVPAITLTLLAILLGLGYNLSKKKLAVLQPQLKEIRENEE